MEGSNLLPEAKLTDRAQAVASVGRILREHPEIETVLVGDGARGTLRSLSAARAAGTVWTAVVRERPTKDADRSGGKPELGEGL